jgi:hypothetical protein
MKLSGKWKSLMYPDISGEFTLTCNDMSLSNPFHEQFTASLDLIYSKTSPYKGGGSTDVPLEGVYEFDNIYKINRFVLRQIEFDVLQYFTLTLNSANNKQWNGYLTCICPVDCVKLTDVKCQESDDKKDEVVDEEFVVTI